MFVWCYIESEVFLKNGPFPASFSLFSSFQYSDLWYWKQTLYQLSHNHHCSWVIFLKNLPNLHRNVEQQFWSKCFGIVQKKYFLKKVYDLSFLNLKSVNLQKPMLKLHFWIISTFFIEKIEQPNRLQTTRRENLTLLRNICYTPVTIPLFELFRPWVLNKCIPKCTKP